MIVVSEFDKTTDKIYPFYPTVKKEMIPVPEEANQWVCDN